LHPSRRCDIPSGHSTVQSIIHSDDKELSVQTFLCVEKLQIVPSCIFPNVSASGRSSVFDQLWDFFPKHRFGKITATVQMKCVLVWTLSFIRQVVHTKFNRLNVILHGLDTRASYMEIACINSTVWTTTFMVRMLKPLIWKLHAAKVQPSKC